MKRETKYKIIQWVMRLLKYNTLFSPPVTMQNRKVILIQFAFFGTESITKEDIKERCELQLFHELTKGDFIEYEYLPDDFGITQITARIRVVETINK